MLNDTTNMVGSIVGSESITITVPASAPNTTNSVVVLDVVGYPSPSTHATAVDDHLSKCLTSSLELDQNYPNSFNLTTVFSYKFPVAGLVKLTV